MRIAAYVGKSLISRAIQTFSRVGYDGISHVAIDTEGDGVYEAWHSSGDGWFGGKVRKISCLDEGHTAGTLVKLYDWPMTDEQRRVCIEWLDKQVGKGYDYRGVLGFPLLRKSDGHEDRLFCSELAIAAGNKCGAILLRAKPYLVMPEQVTWSPRISFIGTYTTRAFPFQ